MRRRGRDLHPGMRLCRPPPNCSATAPLRDSRASLGVKRPSGSRIDITGVLFQSNRLGITPQPSSSDGPLWGTCYACPEAHLLRGDPVPHMLELGVSEFGWVAAEDEAA